MNTGSYNPSSSFPFNTAAIVLASLMVDHPGGVCILALDDQNRALLVSQFRYPYEKVLREIPAGKLEYPEIP